MPASLSPNGLRVSCVCCAWAVLVVITLSSRLQAQIFENMLGKDREVVHKLMQKYDKYLLISHSYQAKVLIYQLTAEYQLYNKFEFNSRGRCTSSHLIGPQGMEEFLINIFEKEGWQKDKANWRDNDLRQLRKGVFVTRLVGYGDKPLISFITQVDYDKDPSLAEPPPHRE